MAQPESDEISMWDAFKPKARILGTFARHTKDHTKEREELLNFIAHMVEDLKDTEDDQDMKNRYQFRVRKFSTVEELKSKDTDKDIAFTFSKEGHDEYCALCLEPFELFTTDINPCRVCTRAYHKDCVKKHKKCSQIDKDCIDRCRTNTGWSCYQCTDLSTLLTESEVKHIIDAFDEIDVNKDTFITEEEFTAYKNRTVHLASTDEGRQHIIYQFNKIDTDRNGHISYCEFVDHETKKMLSKRTSDELVDMLTEKEIVYAKAVFSHMDEDKDGIITRVQALASYKNWYRRLDKNACFHGRDTKTLNLHANVAAKIVMDTEKKNSGTITWTQFLAGQALYIICARPNN